MKSTAFTLSLLFTALPLAFASTCNQQTATDISCLEDDSCGGDTSTDSSPSVTKRAIVPNTPHSSTYSAHLVAKNLLSRRKEAQRTTVAKRQSSSIQCSSDEECFSEASEGLLLCVNVNTGDFTDNMGQSGNAFTGVVTGSDGSATTVDGSGFGTDGGSNGPGQFSTDFGTSTDSGLGSIQTSLGESTGGQVTATAGAGASGSASGQGSPEATSTVAGTSAGGTPSVSGSSNPGQPTGHVAGAAGSAGKAEVDMVAAIGAFGLMAVMI